MNAKIRSLVPDVMKHIFSPRRLVLHCILFLISLHGFMLMRFSCEKEAQRDKSVDYVRIRSGSKFDIMQSHERVRKLRRDIEAIEGLALCYLSRRQAFRFHSFVL